MSLHHSTLSLENGSCPHYYLCHYLPRSAGRDTLSHSLLKFKLGRQPDLSGWIDCALDTLAGGLLPPGATIIRALHHEETCIGDDNPASLDELARALATRFQCHYLPAFLRKYRRTRPIKGFNKEQRVAELRDLYYIGDPSFPRQPFPLSPKSNHILLLDDILTTGTTVRAIIAAILHHYPLASFSVFTLARATYNADLNNTQPLKGRHYQLEQDRDWVLAEPNTGYEPAYSALLLKNWIATDDFPV